MRILLIIRGAPHYVSELTETPVKDSLLRLDKKLYYVERLLYDLDQGEIRVYLEKAL